MLRPGRKIAIREQSAAVGATREPNPEPASVGLIGTGNVGAELLALLDQRTPAGLRLTALANSRRMLLGTPALGVRNWAAELGASPCRTELDQLAHHVACQGGDRGILVDLTPSPQVAGRHARWLVQGFTVVTANKWAAAAPERDWQRLRRALTRDGADYRYSTTVGAGLPVLQTLHALQGAGERVLEISGLFSGTLTFLARGVERGRSFSECLLEAQRRGLTEPDPRIDLSGDDVARKLVIAARAAGIRLHPEGVDVESLVPRGFRNGAGARMLQATSVLDAVWAQAAARAPGEGPALRHVGEVAADGRARVGLRYLPEDHPFVQVGTTDNVFEIRTESFLEQPIFIRGPGAGRRVTAVRVLADMAEAAQRSAHGAAR